MSRIRSIHPKLFTDESYMSLGHAAARFLFGLWTEADDHGMFEWKPLTLKARIFPVHNDDINSILNELAAVNVITTCEVAAKSYGLIRNFCKFQRPKKPTYVHPLPTQYRKYVGLIDDITEPVPHQFPTPSPKSPQRKEGGGRMKEEVNHPLNDRYPLIEVSGSSQKAPQPPIASKIEFYLGEKNEKEIPDRQVVPIGNQFDPSDEWGEYAEKMGFVNGVGQRELEKFIGYWTVGKGSGKRKTTRGWRQAWSNWLEISARRA